MNYQKLMQERVAHLRDRFAGIQIGATTALVDDIPIPNFEKLSPLHTIADVTANRLCVSIRPHDPRLTTVISKLVALHTGISTSTNNGYVIFYVPSPSMDYRHELVRKANSFAEEERVKIRQIRKKANDLAKANGHGTKKIQECTDLNINAINDLLKIKEIDIIRG